MHINWCLTSWLSLFFFKSPSFFANADSCFCLSLSRRSFRAIMSSLALEISSDASSGVIPPDLQKDKLSYQEGVELHLKPTKLWIQYVFFANSTVNTDVVTQVYKTCCLKHVNIYQQFHFCKWRNMFWKLFLQCLKHFVLGHYYHHIPDYITWCIYMYNHPEIS